MICYNFKSFFLVGVLKGRFRCILKERVLHYHPLKAGQIINTVCVLHNMCVRANIPLEDDPMPEDDHMPENVQDARPVNYLADQNILALGQQRRRQLIDMYFH